MNEGIGAKGGKKDRKLDFLNRRKQKRQNKQIEQEQKQKQSKEKNHKQEEIILISNENNQEKTKSVVPLNVNLVLEEESKPIVETTKDNTKQSSKNIPNDDFLKSAKTPPITEKKSKENISNINYDSKEIKDNINQNSKEKISYPPEYPKQELKKEKKGKTINQEYHHLINPSKKHSKESINTQEEFLEKQIIKILEQDIQEKKYQLKKLDSEIYAIQKSIDSTTDKDELEEMENEIAYLLEIIERIKRQIHSLEKTFDYKLPVEEPDNYLIYLVEEYKQEQKDNKKINKQLKENKEFQSLIDMLIEIEEKQQTLEQKRKEKQEQLELEEEQIEKLNNDIIHMEEINKNIKKMLENQKKAIDEINKKLKETVHIHEKVDFITKNVNHTMLELFLLMALLKHNLSMKNNAIAAATAALALDMIIKMTTPIQEKVIIKEVNIQDYEKIIQNCMSDNRFMEKLIHSNLNQISSLRYTFEKEYQAYSYLQSYQDALKNLINLEEDMKERKEDMTRMKRDLEYQLEKNNAKVKKYDSIKAA